MLALVLAVAAGVCLGIGWSLGQIVLVYAALVLSGAGLLLVVLPAWRRRLAKPDSSAGDDTEDEEAIPEDEPVESAPIEEDETFVSAPVEEDEPVAAHVGRQDTKSKDEIEVLINHATGDRLDSGSTVYVRDGRKRFHVGACRLVDMAESEELTLVEAREEAFTPCTICLDVSSPALLSK